MTYEITESGLVVPKSALSKEGFDPNNVYPTEKGHARMNVIPRDMFQSNGFHLDPEDQEQMYRLLGGYYTALANSSANPNKIQGSVEAGGGTIPMFDTKARGLQFFEWQRDIEDFMPDVTTESLFRSGNIFSMNELASSDVKAVGQLYAPGRVVRNFKDNNDPRHHIAPAEAIHEAGGHYQAVYSHAVFQKDPTVFNPHAIIQFFKTIIDELGLEPHSAGFKDPSGVLTPVMGAIVTDMFKQRWPHIPFGVHMHDQADLAPSTILATLEAGANWFDTVPDSWSQGSSHAPAGVMFKLASERGIDLGFGTGAQTDVAAKNQAEKALLDTSLFLKKVKPHYPGTQHDRPADTEVFVHGIAGGQMGGLQEELRENRMLDRLPELKDMVQFTREAAGGVCQVTPAADRTARQALSIILGKDPDTEFFAGYASMLIGEPGHTKLPIDEAWQKEALRQRATAMLDSMIKNEEAVIDGDIASTLKKEGYIDALVDDLYSISAPVRNRERLAEVEQRIKELEAINTEHQEDKTYDLGGKPFTMQEYLNGQIAEAAFAREQRIQELKETIKDLGSTEHMKRAAQKELGYLERDNYEGRSVANLDERLELLQKEAEQLRTAIEKDPGITDKEYEAFLIKGTGEQIISELQESHVELAETLQEKAFIKLAQAGSVITCCSGDMLEPRFYETTQALKEAADKEGFDLPEEGTREFAEAVAIMLLFPNDAVKLFKEIDNPEAWTRLNPDNMTAQQRLEAVQKELRAAKQDAKKAEEEIPSLEEGAKAAEVRTKAKSELLETTIPKLAASLKIRTRSGPKSLSDLGVTNEAQKIVRLLLDKGTLSTQDKTEIQEARRAVTEKLFENGYGAVEKRKEELQDKIASSEPENPGKQPREMRLERLKAKGSRESIAYHATRAFDRLVEEPLKEKGFTAESALYKAETQKSVEVARLR